MQLRPCPVAIGATIQAITRRIVERFEPKAVILFGSCARGEKDQNSDLDLLIRSYETFATYRPNRNSMLRRMLKDSKVLNGRRAG